MLNVNEKKEAKPKSTSEIGTIGEKLVAAHLQKKGFSTNIDTKGPGATDIEAIASNKTILVQVKTGVAPNEPVKISSEEEAAIKRRAVQKTNCEAWEALVSLKEDYSLKNEIVWRKLTEMTKKSN
jgi:hypothetical protein